MTRIARACVVIGLSGCYGYYAPVHPQLVGRDLEIILTDSGSAALASRIGFSVEAVDGRLRSDSADVYSLSVGSTRRRDGIENSWQGELIDIPHRFVASVSERRFSRARTTLFTMALTGTVIAMKSIFGVSGGSNAPGTTPGAPGPR
jgi:hypothetical protein